MNNTINAEVSIRKSGASLIDDNPITCNTCDIEIINFNIKEEDVENFYSLMDNPAFDFWKDPEEDIY